MRAALALPNAGGRRPAVIVIHEVFGLNDDIRRITGRFADLGYVALAVDLFDTEGVKALCVLRTMLSLPRGSGRVFDDLDAARTWLGGRADVDSSATGVVGFCLGGGFALLWATRAPLKAAANFYGAVPKTAEALRGVCPVFGGYGGRDRLFAPHGARLEKLLAEVGVPHDVKVYPNAGHSFMSHHASSAMTTIAAWGPMAAGFDPDAEADSWRRIETFYRRHLG